MTNSLSTTYAAQIPQHLAIIINNDIGVTSMQGLSHLEYLKTNIANMHLVIRACLDTNIRYLTIYVFSSKNGLLSRDDVLNVKSFMEYLVDQELDELHKNNVKFRCIGHLVTIDQPLREKILRAAEITKNNDRLNLNIAFNYSGREEILQAVRSLIINNTVPEDLDETIFRNHLFTVDQPDTDLVIHLGGDMRVSDFLIWQATYAEDYVTQLSWHDFDTDEFNKALKYFSHRERRFGVLPELKNK